MSKFFNYLSKHKGGVIVIIAALLLELISTVQYYYVRNMLEVELEKHAESELTSKSIIILGMLKTMENTLEEHLWDVERNIAHADSMFEVTKRVIMKQPKAVGSFLVFSPDYYPGKARLFEPYAYKDELGIHVRDLAGESDHDYTTHPAFTKMLESKEPFWTDPYKYEGDGIVKSLTTYLYPLHDKQGKLIAMSGLDVSLEWLGDTLNTRHIYPSSYILLMTESGELISGPLKEQTKEKDVEKVVKMINNKDEKRDTSHSGLSKIIRFKDYDNNGASVFCGNIKGKPHWQIAMVCHDAEVYEELHRMRLNMLILMFFVFSILCLIIYSFARNERRLSLAKAEKERIDNELKIATGIQNAMLAQDEGVTGYPDISISAVLKPAREVGGDLYNYFIRDEKLFFCIGDVSGKGIPSALVMAMTQTLFRTMATHEGNPGSIMKMMNEAACRNNKTNMFATLFIGVLDLPTGRLRYCNAGHDIPVLMDTSGVSFLPVKANLPVGLFDDFLFEMQEMVIDKSTILVLYTDGLTEAWNTSHQQFGSAKVIETLKQCQGKTPEEIISTMTEKVRLFVGEEEQSDDLTMLVLKYLPQTDSYKSYGELTIMNDVSYLKDLHTFVISIAEKLRIDKPLTQKIRLAIEEAVTNIINYAYAANIKGQISIKAMSDEENLKFVIADSGMAFNPTEVATTDTSLSVEDRPVGGLGILLARKLMDSINYERIDGKNILTLIKNKIHS